MFAYNPERVPVQRAHAKNCRKPGRPVAYYPTCTYCREKVEVAATSVASTETLAAQAS
jgi:hypothetical protein